MPTAKLTIITIVSTLAYLGLAILGAGGFAVFFSHEPQIVLAIATCVMAAIAPFSGGNLSPGEREDRANRWVLIAFGVIGCGRVRWAPAAGKKKRAAAGRPLPAAARLSRSSLD
jgi:hypothetical protein